MFIKTVLIILSLPALLMIGPAAWHITPIIKPFPKPTGAYTVGHKPTTGLIIIDRKFMHSNTCAKRELMVQIWHPALFDKGDLPAPYLSDRLPFIKQKLIQEGYPEIIVNRFFKGLSSFAFTGKLSLPECKTISHSYFLARTLFTQRYVYRFH